jgi:hypothetical protein
MLGFAAAEILEGAIPTPDIFSLTTVQYNEMLAGVVYGILDKNNETEIETCLIDGEDEAIAVFGVFEDYRHGRWIEGSRAMEQVVAAIPTLKLVCSKETLMPDVLSLEAWATFFEQPTADVESQIKKNVLRHSIALTLDLHTAETYWNAGEFFKFGEEVGIMAVIATQ